jgi:hypothetical protein
MCHLNPLCNYSARATPSVRPKVDPHIGTMTNETGYGVLTDAQWEALAPLIVQCRPPHKTEHKNLRRTIEAIVWRHENGALALPGHFLSKIQ